MLLLTTSDETSAGLFLSLSPHAAARFHRFYTLFFPSSPFCKHSQWTRHAPIIIGAGEGEKKRYDKRTFETGKKFIKKKKFSRTECIRNYRAGEGRGETRKAPSESESMEDGTRESNERVSYSDEE